MSKKNPWTGKSENGHKGWAKGNPGKPFGSLAVKTKEWEELGRAVVNVGAERYMRLLGETKDPEFMDRFERILEYFKPKQQRAIITGDDTDTGISFIDVPKPAKRLTNGKGNTEN